MNTVENRYDFVYLFDCQDGNPNGDPDADNSPRFDPETFQGLVSDVCLKRKIRDYVSVKKAGQSGYEIYVQSGYSLESKQKQAYDHLSIKPKSTDGGDIARAKEWMCLNFFDVRAFGAVMSTTDFNCGQVRGPVQLTFARSIDRVFTTEHGITRVAYTREEKKAGTTATTEMGRKHTVAYGLYRAHGFINPVFARQTGFSEEDLELLWNALENMFDIDRSAARGLMAARGLYVFKHRSDLGEAPAHKLFETVSPGLKEGVVSPRSFQDYLVTEPDPASLPPGVELLTPFTIAAAA
jgi:CRISPR-associated protein Csd2